MHALSIPLTQQTCHGRCRACVPIVVPCVLTVVPCMCADSGAMCTDSTAMYTDSSAMSRQVASQLSGAAPQPLTVMGTALAGSQRPSCSTPPVMANLWP
jgi:hypothetical protein